MQDQDKDKSQIREAMVSPKTKRAVNDRVSQNVLPNCVGEKAKQFIAPTDRGKASVVSHGLPCSARSMRAAGMRAAGRSTHNATID